MQTNYGIMEAEQTLMVKLLKTFMGNRGNRYLTEMVVEMVADMLPEITPQ